MKILLPLLVLFAFLSVCNAQQGCSHSCYDYNRICPAVKDRSFYDTYKQQHDAGTLGQFNDAPLPPEPDCNNFFYKYACPHSCGACTPCKVVDEAYVQNLIKQVEQKMAAGDASCTASVSQLQQKINTGDASTKAALDQLNQKITAGDAALQASLNQLDQKQTAASAEMQAYFTAKIDELEANSAKQPVNCNPCTEKLSNVGNGQMACLPKYDVIYEVKGECSCDCGEGTRLKEKLCVEYKEQNGKCQQVDSFLQNCPEGAATKTEVCNNGACTVTRIVEKTSSAKWSESKNAMSYKAFTKSGKSCNLGVVKMPNNKQRDKGDKDTYDQGDIEDSVCSNLCMAKNEVFDYIEITVDGTDGWKSDYVEVTVNGAEQKYSNSNFLDDKETLKYTKK